MKAYILISARRGAANKLAMDLRKIKHVTSSDCVFGRYDVITIVESAEMKTISQVVNQIQKQEGILRTETAFSQYVEGSTSHACE